MYMHCILNMFDQHIILTLLPLLHQKNTENHGHTREVRGMVSFIKACIASCHT